MAETGSIADRDRFAERPLGIRRTLERIHAKIAELEAKIADLRIAERGIRALEKLPARKTRPAPGPKPKPKRKPEASNQAEARKTIADWLDHHEEAIAVSWQPSS